MPILLEDLAQETSASNAHAALRLDREALDLNGSTPLGAALEERRQKAGESSQQATVYVISRVAQAEEIWQLGLVALRKESVADDAQRLLRSFLTVFESGRRLIQAA